MHKTYSKKIFRRNLLIYKQRCNGKKLMYLGNKYHLSHQRIRQICQFVPEMVYVELIKKPALIKKTIRIYPKKLKRVRNIFACLKQRCNNPKSRDYKYYGGRGIKCEWNNFDDFYKDMKKGYKEDLTIDRIDVNKNYCKENCRWLPRYLQPVNRRAFSEWNLISKFWLKNKGI